MATTEKLFDIGPMRAAAAALLGPEGPLPRFDELADQTDQLRRQLRELGPAVERALEALPGGATGLKRSSPSRPPARCCSPPRARAWCPRLHLRPDHPAPRIGRPGRGALYTHPDIRRTLASRAVSALHELTPVDVRDLAALEPAPL